MKIVEVITKMKDADGGNEITIVIKEDNMVSDIIDGKAVPCTNIKISNHLGEFSFSLDDNDLNVLIDSLMLRQNNKIM